MTARRQRKKTACAERVVAALIAAAALAGCGSAPDADAPGANATPRGPATIDERAGTYRGVGIGSTRAQARRELGRVTAKPTDPLAPIGIDPTEVGVPPAPQEPAGSGGIAIWRFEGAAMAAGHGRAWLLSVVAEDAVTSRGVGVGSSLDEVRAAYPNAKCDTENEGTEYTPFEYCMARIASDRYLYFAYDPVRSVTVSRETLRAM